MTEIQTFEPDGRAIPFVEEGDGPVKLVLIPERGQDALGVVGHYLAEEAGFHVVRIGYRIGSGGRLAAAEHAEDVIAVMDHLGLDHSWIGGHGFGGTVARAAVAATSTRTSSPAPTPEDCRTTTDCGRKRMTFRSTTRSAVCAERGSEVIRSWSSALHADQSVATYVRGCRRGCTSPRLDGVRRPPRPVVGRCRPARRRRR